MKKWIILLALPAAIVFLFSVSQASYIFSSEIVMQAVPGDSTAFFEAQLVNTGVGRDVYIITKQENIPETWYCYLCIDSLCLPGDSGQAILDPGEISMIKPEMIPMMTAGDGEVTVTVQPASDPDDIKQITFRAVSGYATLLVNAGLEENQYREYYSEALANAEVEFNFWDLNFSSFRYSDLLNFRSMLIYSGDRLSQIFTGDEIEALTEFCLSGGNLLLTGQGIASTLCGTELLEIVVGAGCESTHDGPMQIVGIAGNPVGDGLQFSIEGGDGAYNQVEPDEIVPVGEATASFAYSSGAIAGTTKATAQNGMAFLGFGLEAIDNAADRAEVVDRVFVWFDQVTSVAGNLTAVLPTAEIVGCYPNPFNPTTSIRYNLSLAGDVTIDIYNIIGQRVTTLFDGTGQAGYHTINWRADECPSGVYFARLEAAGYQSSIKMLLLK